MGEGGREGGRERERENERERETEREREYLHIETVYVRTNMYFCLGCMPAQVCACMR